MTDEETFVTIVRLGIVWDRIWYKIHYRRLDCRCYSLESNMFVVIVASLVPKRDSRNGTSHGNVI